MSMIDTTELVAAIKRARRGQEGKPLHLLVSSAVPDEMTAVLAQLDIKVVVSTILTSGSAFLVDADEKRFWDLAPPPPAFREFNAFKWWKP